MKKMRLNINSIDINFYQNQSISDCARRIFLNSRRDGRKDFFYRVVERTYVL